MSKYIFTYLLITLITSTVVIPTYMSLSEEICETSVVMDTEKDSDEAHKELEIKFLHSDQESFTYNNAITQIKLPYKIKVYNPVYKKQECPPPEGIV
ncbi:hypothetical protein SAMN04489761_2574 [Tenacibaculum sp. MAR_2009_124]|uniref:hypothetical protein n=1 Tax=Tenacibaculum sp. MAR_2009_124 TaxID=1250059 RepID=UPI0008980385|nr:hypothetical protein [Tenacibaculum sp. MAR_2009_124]SEC28403.1 hypothetical protein SAMN04489761_2574 [Tenacibaculum sp. MAR_2009_124]